MTNRSLKECFFEACVRSPDPTSYYYQVTLTADEHGNLHRAIFTHWEGFADPKRKLEIRKASLMHPKEMVDTFRENQERCLVIHETEVLHLFLLYGGHAVIEQKLAEDHLSDWLQPTISSPVGFCGFESFQSLPQSAKNRAPNAKLRMQVLKRDDYRCRICGRRASDYTDIELHVHHIRPWSFGGPTQPDNLLTLCNTCHRGLDPHFAIELFEMLPRKPHSLCANDHRDRHREGVKNYSKAVFCQITDN